VNAGAFFRASIAVISPNRFELFDCSRKVGISGSPANQHLHFLLLYCTELSVVWKINKFSSLFMPAIISGSLRDDPGRALDAPELTRWLTWTK
jgi:hypothetical protein